MFSQKVYQYIKEENTQKLKEVLDSKIPQVIINSLLTYAIKQDKIESVKILICYCADFEAYYQNNLFNLKNYGTRKTRLLINDYIIASRKPKTCE